MTSNFKKVTFCLLATVTLSTTFGGFIEASELSQKNPNTTEPSKYQNSEETKVLYDRAPTIEELKNTNGDIEVRSTEQSINPNFITLKAASPISNRKKFTKTINLSTVAGGGGASSTLVGYVKQTLGKAVKIGPLAGVSATAGGLMAMGYKKIVIHGETMYTNIDPETGAKLKKKKKMTKITSYKLKK